ncbi:MAG: hypothetical protein ACE5FH_08160 [Candidatus Zixiibacteriota bacterium]
MLYRTDLLHRLLVLLVVVATCMSGSAFAGKKKSAAITYVASEGVYLGAGSSNGLKPGDTLSVYRGGKRVGRIVVTNVSSNSAAAQIVAGSGKPQKGDRVSMKGFVPPVSPQKSKRAAKSRKPHKRRTTLTRTDGPNRLSGGASFQNYYHKDMSGSNQDWSQSGVRFHIRIDDMFGGGGTFRMRHFSRLHHRSQQQYLHQDKNEWTHQTTEFAVIFGDNDSPARWGVGRVLSPDVRGMGYIDGGYYSRRFGDHYRVGVAGGTVSEYLSTQTQLDHRKFGFFGAYEIGNPDNYKLAVSGALSTESDDGETSRDFLYLQSILTHTHRFSLFQSAEIDYNRGWRYGQSGARLNFTNYFGSVRYQAHATASVNLSYDARRNIRRMATRTVPDSLFDNSTHQGVRAGVRFQPHTRLSFGVTGGIRMRSGRLQDNRFANFSARVSRFPLKRHSITANLSIVQTEFTNGYRPTVTYRFPVTRRMYLNFMAAAYIYNTGSASTRNYFINGSTSYNLSNRYYLQASVRQYFDSNLQSIELFTEFGTSL